MQGEDEVARLREENEQLRAVRPPSTSVFSPQHYGFVGYGKLKFSRDAGSHGPAVEQVILYVTRESAQEAGVLARWWWLHWGE